MQIRDNSWMKISAVNTDVISEKGVHFPHVSERSDNASNFTEGGKYELIWNNGLFHAFMRKVVVISGLNVEEVCQDACDDGEHPHAFFWGRTMRYTVVGVEWWRRGSEPSANVWCALNFLLHTLTTIRFYVKALWRTENLVCVKLDLFENKIGYCNLKWKNCTVMDEIDTMILR